ncbi:MAG: C40 family peptidase [Micromonosporaceae bacterium]|nr:C40 family peptidase [Micromonosporaceae bacterium]
MRLDAGQRAAVRVAVATLWAGPDAVRPVDAPALGCRPDIRAWVAGMDPDQRVGRGVLSQLLLGERVQVDQVDGGWARVVALEQPAGKLDPRGYPGWLPAAQLAPVSDVEDSAPAAEAGEAATRRWVVDATATALRDAPAGDVVLPGVVLGTRLPAAGPPYRGWVPVRVPGEPEPRWALARDVRPDLAWTPSAEQVLGVAARLLDVAYVWGGVSAYGIDCSGLVHLAWRRFGVRLPRDADDQAEATTPIALGEERPGDLYFFARPGRKIHHIGFVAAAPDGQGRRRMLHACYTRRQVVDEPVRGERAATLVGAHRVLP